MDTPSSSSPPPSHAPSPSRAPPAETIWYTRDPDETTRRWVVYGKRPAMDTDPPVPVTPSKQDPNAIVPWATPEKSSPPQLRYYSGVTAIESGSGQLSLFHHLSDRGTFTKVPPELEALRDHEEGRKPLAALMQPGLAAVCIEISDPATDRTRLSGFRLRRDGVDVVVSCARFTEWPNNNREEFDEVVRRVSQDTTDIRARQTADVDAEMTECDDVLKLQLVAVHCPWDIAIFRILQAPDDDEDNTVIDWSQIHFVVEEDRGKLGSKDLWWSVGFNLNNNQARLNSDWKGFFLRQPLSIQQDIAQRYLYDENHPPAVDFLKTNRRTVSFGKMDEFAETGFPPQSYQVSLNLSAWYGRSGSMVFSRGNAGVDGEESHVQVYGLIVGGSSETNHNVMTLFTEEMRGWLEKAFHSELEEHPIDFSRRFVMAIGDEQIL
ncbi:hypothetical protein CLAIMM_10554 [Cladophialophora immunda]|nr:hypothetical protein CLAIMM_10554 [Cladophialophora immunda]